MFSQTLTDKMFSMAPVFFASGYEQSASRRWSILLFPVWEYERIICCITVAWERNYLKMLRLVFNKLLDCGM